MFIRSRYLLFGNYKLISALTGIYGYNNLNKSLVYFLFECQNVSLSVSHAVMDAMFSDDSKWLLFIDHHSVCTVTGPRSCHTYGNCTDTSWRLHWDAFRSLFISFWSSFTLQCQLYLFVGKSTGIRLNTVLFKLTQLC